MHTQLTTGEAMRKILSPGDDLMKPLEVSKEIGITEGTLRVWRCTGRHALPFHKIGASVRYLRSDVQAWLAGRRGTQTGA